MQCRVVHQFLFALQHLLAGKDFQCAQAILIKIVRINAVDTEGSVAVASPSATEIKFCEDAPDVIVAREDKPQCVVLTIRGVREANLTQQRREEGARRTQTVDTQGVVGTVLVCPLCVIYQSRRQGIQFEVTHTIRADHHRRILLIEGFHNLLQRLRRGIEIVRVELYRKASAAVIIDGLVPTAADAEIRALWDDMHEPLIVDGLQQLCCLVRGVIVDHDDIILEACLLREG